MQAKRTLAIITGKQNSYRVDLSMLKIRWIDLYSRVYQLDDTGPQSFPHCLGMNYYVNFLGGIGSNVFHIK